MRQNARHAVAPSDPVVGAAAGPARGAVGRRPPAARVFRIGTLGNESSPAWDGLRQGLRDLGHVEGRTSRSKRAGRAGRRTGFPALAREIVASKVDVIVASSMQAIRAAKDATSTIPIVMVLASFPDKLGLVDSLARPGGNVTGLSTLTPQLIAKQRRASQGDRARRRRVAVLVDPTNPIEAIGTARAGSRRRGDPHGDPDIRGAGARRAARGLGGGRVERGRRLVGVRQSGQFQEPAAHHRCRAQRAGCQACTTSGCSWRRGGLASYGPSYFEQFRRAASYVDKILKGAKPADLPVEQPLTFELSINRATATRAGVEHPIVGSPAGRSHRRIAPGSWPVPEHFDEGAGRR